MLVQTIWGWVFLLSKINTARATMAINVNVRCCCTPTSDLISWSTLLSLLGDFCFIPLNLWFLISKISKRIGCWENTREDILRPNRCVNASYEWQILKQLKEKCCPIFLQAQTDHQSWGIFQWRRALNNTTQNKPTPTKTPVVATE